MVGASSPAPDRDGRGRILSASAAEAAAGSVLALMGALGPKGPVVGPIAWGLLMVASGIGLYRRLELARAFSIIASVSVGLIAAAAVPVAGSVWWLAFACLSVGTAGLVLRAVGVTMPRWRPPDPDREPFAPVEEPGPDAGIGEVGAAVVRWYLTRAAMVVYMAVWTLVVVGVFMAAGFGTFQLVAGVNGLLGFPDSVERISPMAGLALFLVEGGVLVGASLAATILTFRRLSRLFPVSTRRWIPWSGGG